MCQGFPIINIRNCYFYRMKKTIPLFFCVLLALGCKSTKIGATDQLQLRFLDEYVIAEDLMVEGTLVGGLSGIDYYNGNYYLVCDHPSDPRIYKTKINIQDEHIDTIIFNEVIKVNTSSPFLKDKHLDMEGIIYNKKDSTFILSSEGAIKNGKDPAVFRLREEGTFVDSFAIPEYFLAKSEQKPRNNGVFEGLAHSYDHEGIWVAAELPLKSDGPKPKLIRTKSPVRITYFDKKSKQAVKQFPYLLEPIAKIPWLYFAVNGVSDLLQYAPNKFLIVERGFAAGHGSNGNTVRIFDVDATMATNTLEKSNLNVAFYNPAKKELVFDFKWIAEFLSREFIDNIEGITFGPRLPNGNRSLILISDNNFNSLGEQLNQVILMEFKIKEQ